MGRPKGNPKNRLGLHFWTPGQAGEIARLLGLRENYVYAILRRQKGVSVERAKILEQGSKAVLHFAIPWTDWIQNKTTRHPAFKPLPGEPMPIRPVGRPRKKRKKS